VLSAAGTQLAAAHMLGGASGADYHLEFGYSCMGHELPAGLGVRMAGSEGEIVVYVGDGTYLLNPTELLTAAQEGFKVTLVLVENHGFQSIRQLQMDRDGRPFGNEFRRRGRRSGRLDGPFVDVDLAANAQSLGARCWRVDTAAALKAALCEARQAPGVNVIVAEAAADDGLPATGGWWDISVAEVSGDAVTRERRREYEGQRRRQRYHHHRKDDS
jgi:3D-(3,5/4)-trihydroxycyclohexane-1,2-dione acylhydrolase (decyclizing)